MKEYNFITKKLLIQKYSKSKKSEAQIAVELSCTKCIIHNRLIKYNIPRRTNSEAQKGKTGKKASGYKHGKYCKKYYCPDCQKRKIFTEITPNSKRCRSCAAEKHIKDLGHPFKGKHHTIKSRKKISQTRIKKGLSKGENNYFFNKFGVKAANWRGGISFEPYPVKFNRQLKEQIRTRDNHICQLCGVKQEYYYRKLDIHHIDYNKKNLNPNNLISLCSGCNSKVNGDRSYYYTYFKYIIENINVKYSQRKISK